MLYFVKNKSGNVSDVTERIYNQRKKNPEYECWTEDPYEVLPEEVAEKSTDYKVDELRDMRDQFSDEEWAVFTEEDERKTVEGL